MFFCVVYYTGACVLFRFRVGWLEYLLDEFEVCVRIDAKESSVDVRVSRV